MCQPINKTKTHQFGSTRLVHIQSLHHTNACTQDAAHQRSGKTLFMKLLFYPSIFIRQLFFLISIDKETFFCYSQRDLYLKPLSKNP